MFWLIGKVYKSDRWSQERKPLAACAVEIADAFAALRDRYADVSKKNLAVIRHWTKSDVAAEEAEQVACANLRQARFDAANVNPQQARFDIDTDTTDDVAAATAAATAAANAAATVAAATAAADAAAITTLIAETATIYVTFIAADAAKICKTIRKYFPRSPIG